MTDLPIIPSAVVGSHGKPSWWFASLQALERGEFGPAPPEAPTPSLDQGPAAATPRRRDWMPRQLNLNKATPDVHRRSRRGDAAHRR